ncbi:MAG: hypothetical protein ABI548_03650 [Polyangiaceae bacterium]
MRFVVIARASALIACGALLSACPKKDSDAAPEPAAAATPTAPTAVNDKAGVEPPVAPAAPAVAAPAAAAPAKKKKEDQGGW